MTISDVTLVSVNWNQKKAMEIMLKSYVNFHYANEKMNLILVDNGSTDGSKRWLIENNVPFISLEENIGHEAAINFIYPIIKTKYVLIVDTDIMFKKNVIEEYRSIFSDEVKLIGDHITYHTPPIVPRIAAWFFFLDIEAMKLKGVNTFRDCENWTYDVGSWQTEQVINAGYKFYAIKRNTFIEQEDTEIIGMDYDTHLHFGKLSWDILTHHDKADQVNKRRNYIMNLNQYSDIDLKNKFK